MNQGSISITTALDHQRSGRRAEAEQVYRSLLEQQPESIDALNLLGALLHELGRYDEALTCFEQVLTLKPAAESHNSVAIVLKAQGKYTEAVEQYRKALALKPNQPEVMSNLGNALKESGSAADAIACYQDAIALNPHYAEAHNNLGISYKEQGKLDEAIQSYQTALRLKPNYVDAHHNLGIIWRIQGKLDKAIDYFRQAIALKPTYIDAHISLGSTLHQQGKLDEAIAQFNHLLTLKPDSADTYNNLAMVLQEQGKVEEAIAAFKQALVIRPDYPGVCNNLGNLLLESDRTEEAIASYRQALALRPTYAEACNNLGNALQRLGKRDEAVAEYHRALELRPNFVEALSNLGAVLRDQKKTVEGISYLEQALSLQPGFAEIYNNLGNAYQELDRLEDAIACYRKAVELKPELAEVRSNLGNMLQYIGEFDEAFEHFEQAIATHTDFAGAYNNLGIARRNSGDLDAAFAAYDRAIELKPDFIEAHWNKALNYLLIGDLENGFAGYEQRFEWSKFIEQNPPRNFTQPRWDGSPLDGKTILLYAEQGMGDTIQFIRYIGFVAQQGGRIILECHPPLANLLQSIPAVEQIIPYGTPLPAFDVHAPLMSLPFILGTTLENIPADIPYLPSSPSTPSLPSPTSSSPIPASLKIGFVWDGNPQNPYNRSRTCPLELLLPLAQIPGVSLYSLQKEPKPEDLELLQAHPEVQDLRSLLNNFTDTSSLIQQLDLIIAVDTAVAHLAGALGKTTWLLLPFAPDWRWMCDRDDSPWYPTMRLFRQPSYGNWEPVLEALKAALVARVTGEEERSEGRGQGAENKKEERKKPKTKHKKQKGKDIDAKADPLAFPSFTQNPKAQSAADASKILPGGTLRVGKASPKDLQNSALRTPHPTPNPPPKSTLPESLKVAVRHHQAGRIEAAKQTCRDVLEQQPDLADGWHLLALIAHQERNLDDAIAHYQRAIAADPNHCDSYNNLAVALHEQGKFDDAIAHYQKVLALKPDYADAHNNYANALREKGRLAEAVHHYQQAIAMNPTYADAYNNLGLAYYAMSNFEQAAAAYRQAVAVRPNFPQALNHLGNALKEMGNFAEAAVHYQQAISFKPDYAKAYNNWGNIFRDEGDLQTAIQYYDQATAIEPNFSEAHWNKALTLLVGGDLERGFAEYEWRKHVNLPSFKSLRDFPGPRWDGSPLKGQLIFLHAEQGMGDLIQFVRYVPLVVQLGGRVILECHPPLVNLLQTLPGVETLVPYGSAPPPYHIQAPLLSLPTILGITPETIPADIPYLIPPTSAAALPAPSSNSSLAAPLKIGFVWSGNPGNPYNRNRAVPLADLLLLADLPNVELYSLQKDLVDDDLALLRSHPQVHDLHDLLTDFIDTASLIQELDLIISVDTAVTHLAGALGKPTWLLLPFAPDWRWMLHRDDSPWYPTVRIFRQPTAGDWDSVLQQVRTALEAVRSAEDGVRSVNQVRSAEYGVRSVNPEPRIPNPEPRTTERLSTALQHYHNGELAKAEQLYRQILQQQPDQADALHVLGVILCQTKRSEEAIAHLRHLTQLQPDFAEGWGNLGGALQEQREFEDAIACYERSLAINSANPNVHQNLSVVLLDLNRPETAVHHAEQVVAARPDSPDAFYNLGFALRRSNRVTEAIAAYRQAIALQPDFVNAHKNLGHALLLTGDFTTGFVEYQWRWQQEGWAVRPFAQPEWDGSDLNGKTILLHAEQGMGDTLQFIRYAPLVKARGGRVIVECQEPLLRLLTPIPSIDQLVPQDAPLPPFDVHAPLLNLPRILGTTLDTIPVDIPYLLDSTSTFSLPSQTPNSVRIASPQELIRPSFKVGLVWAGNPSHRNNRFRSCRLEQFSTLFDLANVTFYSLQKGDAAAELSTLPVHDVGSQLQDFADTACAIAQLDLIITVDTAVAHLAGALGKPVWVLLAFAPDWRWMLDRDDSPWYPTLRLFRQPHPGDWDSMMQHIRNELERTVSDSLRSANDRQAANDTVHTLPAAPRTLHAEHPIDTRTSLSPISLSWHLNGVTNWGILGTQLALHLRHHSQFEPVLQHPLAASNSLTPLEVALLQSLEAESSNPSNGLRLQAIADGFTPIAPSPPANPQQTIALVALEDTHLDNPALAAAKSCRAIVTGSTWNADLLRSYGLEVSQIGLQGIDPTLFYPGKKGDWLGDRFVIFPPGKLSYTHGQDVLIAAFKAFQSRHADALLLTAWWTDGNSLQGLDHAHHVTGVPKLNPQGQPETAQWLSQNGLPSESFLVLEPVAYALLSQVLRQVDVAVFPNRCEAGLNHSAIASLACGVPTVLSNNTGNRDLTQHNLGFPLQSQRRVKAPAEFVGVEGWGESDVEELVETLEYLYVHRAEAQQRSLASADWLRSRPWSIVVKEFATVLSNIVTP
ncbi:tetratricopeptide repeat protein [Phormidium sp. CLA17]|uniref:tetratricopeptide repeat protein n=1 Tax=Leptolyngbya sp. Cla-17 TaxID=2803751 RepID=UPI0014909F31|nr:tetratricopeptide repeat protein [Leptolyngbya sp. Cla-17]MBM0741934.1 tetratricopeptide repeat protein [Leptolyngbya sp. Cla-17]